MKNTYTIQERKVYDVYKNGSPVKSFPTLEKAEEYKRKKEEKENGAKKGDIKTTIAGVLLIISAFGIIISLCLQKCNHITAGYFIALFSGLIIGSCSLYFFTEYSIDKSICCYKRAVVSFFTNIFFSATPMIFVIPNPKFFNELFFLIPTLIIYIVTFILLNIFVKINKGDDTSLLKATNYFIAFIFTAIKLLQEKIYPEEKGFLISFFMLLPLLLTQSLYELFDSKSKANDENKATPIQIQEEQK